VTQDIGEPSLGSYEVKWSIVVDARSPRGAASLGLKWLHEQQEDGSLALVVTHRQTKRRTVVRNVEEPSS
jgi:hypothetical protein